MSDRNKNITNFLTGIFKYNRNELSGKERNSLEKEFQKDPFAEEAAEGFKSVTEDEALRDITMLRKKLKTRTSGNRRIILYRIAAGVAVLTIISALVIYIEKDKNIIQIAINTIQIPEAEILKSPPTVSPSGQDTRSAKPQAKYKEQSRPVSTSKESKADEKPEAAEEFKSINSRAVGTVSSEATKPSEVHLEKKRMAEKPDLSLSALNEVVVVAYDDRKDEAGKEYDGPDHTAPAPSNGRPEFNKYVQQSLHRPDSLTSGQRAVVVINFIIRKNGDIDSIRIVRSPGKLFSDEAIRVLKSGPAWKPATENGKQVDDSVRLKFVFR
jgi:outer membrane biosynthesis protein TonB